MGDPSCGRQVRERRRALGLSQEEPAACLGLDVAARAAFVATARSERAVAAPEWRTTLLVSKGDRARERVGKRSVGSPRR